MKKINFLFIFLFGIFSFFGANISVVNADVSVFNVGVGTDTFYPNEINKLVLHIEIDEAPNTLKAITVQNIASSRTAENFTDIEKISIWLDNGDGFFIVDTETKLGQAIWDNTDSWDFSGEYAFSEKITLWITADISYTAVNNRRIKMQIPALLDTNSNLEYDLGDEGIFLSDKTGPSGPEMNYSLQTISTAGGVCAHDSSAPSAPADFQVENTGAGNEIQLKWTNPPELDFSYVKIYRSKEAGIKGDLFYSVSESSKIDAGLQDGTEYYYKIEAIDQCGNSSVGTEQMSAIPMVAVEEPVEPVEPVEPEEEEIIEEVEEAEEPEELEIVKPISEMTVAEVKAKIAEIQQQIILLLTQLIAFLSE